MSGQTLLFDTRVAILQERDNGFDVVNIEEIRTESSINLLRSGELVRTTREDFEKEVKKCYVLKKVRWLN